MKYTDSDGDIWEDDGYERRYVRCRVRKFCDIPSEGALEKGEMIDKELAEALYNNGYKLIPMNPFCNEDTRKAIRMELALTLIEVSNSLWRPHEMDGMDGIIDARLHRILEKKSESMLKDLNQ